MTYTRFDTINSSCQIVNYELHELPEEQWAEINQDIYLYIDNIAVAFIINYLLCEG